MTAALKLTTYAGERDRSGGQLLADVLLDLYGRHGVQTSVLLRGALGFGGAHRLHTDRLLTLSEDLPVVTVAVDREERIAAMLPEVLALRRRGLVTLERAQLATAPAQGPPELAHEATKLTLYLGRRDRVDGRPAHLRVCELLQEAGVDGASALLGVDGTRDGERRRAAFLSANAAVPVMLIAVGRSPAIGRALEAIGPRLEQPLLTLERIRVCKRDGQRLGTPDPLPGQDSSGLPLWQKLMVYSSEAATVNGRPLSTEIVRRLRATDCAGATVLRGVWGFHGAAPPHGDRLLALRRHVPTLTIVVDTPPRIAGAFAVIDELTSEHGLVTSEMVPAAAATESAAGRLALARHRY